MKDSSNPPQDQISALVNLYRSGQMAEAEQACRKLLHNYPQTLVAINVLGATLQGQGKLLEAVHAFAKAIHLNPDYADSHSNLGITLRELGKFKEAEASHRKAIALKPDYAVAHSNLGNTLHELGEFGEAEASHRKAVALKPDYAEAHNNLGITLQELGRLEEAEGSHRKAIALKAGYAEAHCNLGNTLRDLGRLDEAEASYKQAIELDPCCVESQQSLIELLTGYLPKEKSSHSIVKVDQQIKEITFWKKTSGFISDEIIIQMFNKSTSIIKRHGLKLGTHLSQVYRRNSVDLNCKRHKKIFSEFNVIPRLCFGCYKVQVEPRSVLELIKLFVVFDRIKLIGNNTRKCMIELRSQIPGFYKGLIYCSSLEEAFRIADYLEPILKESIRSELPVTVKRGCSEYSDSFPEYKEINKSGNQLMNYNEAWQKIEQDYDSRNPISINDIVPSLSSLNLSDILIMRNWIDYAKGIGDPSAKLLNHDQIFSQSIYGTAKNRVETNP